MANIKRLADDYLNSLLWSSLFSVDENHPDYDEDHSPQADDYITEKGYELDPSVILECEKRVIAFIKELKQHTTLDESRFLLLERDRTMHEFCLESAGHGSGFFDADDIDRGLKERLSLVCKNLRHDSAFYLNDNGLVCLE